MAGYFVCAYGTEKGAELMWPEWSAWAWWGMSAALLTVLLTAEYGATLARRFQVKVRMPRFTKEGREKRRFGELADEILSVIEDRERKDTEAVRARCIALMRMLDELGIPYPRTPRDDQRAWWDWLPRLYGFAKVGNMKDARLDEHVFSTKDGRYLGFGRRADEPVWIKEDED
ncbi:MAG: hypothetical protein OXF11_21640 [Deltaproteobacteria bacterium]|nr:hypothetical protein [Deltaproteobacteria bacterium]